MSEAIEDLIESQKDKLMAYCPNGKYPKLNLGVTYFAQRDNYTMPDRTCNSSANAMYLDWLRRATYRNPLPGGDDPYLRSVLKIADTIEHWAQTAAIKQYGFGTKWIQSNKDDDDRQCVYELLKAGFPVVVNILHRGTIENPRGGHVVCAIGARSNGNLIVHDPYGTLESGYSDTRGMYSKIDAENFKARWQGGYRILA